MKSSVIIPTAGRRVEVRLAIQSLLALAPKRNNAEILVIDNNVQEATAEDIRRYCATLDDSVRYVREPSPGLSAARHRGFAESAGEILSFIDDDVEVSQGWLAAIQRQFEDPEVGMVGGPSLPKFDSSIPVWFWDFFSHTPYGGWMCPWLSLIDIGRNVEGISPNFIWGLNFSIRRSVLERCGGFHPDAVPPDLQRWQGDGETGLTMKVETAGFRANYAQDALLLHFCGAERLNQQYFAKRAFYQGVCESFTRIRAGDEPHPESTPYQGSLVLHKCREMAEHLMGRLWRRNSIWAPDAAEVWELVKAARMQGWRFHQEAVAADPKLLAWVRRDDFLDADIRKEIG